MDASLAIDAVSTSIGAGGLLIATLANRRAKQANRQAEIANDLAARSLAKAEEANRIAEQGNQIAGDANAVAQRALAAQADTVKYCWRLKIDSDLAVLAVNDSAHTAHQVTVIVDRDGHVEARAQADHCPAFGELPLDLTSLIEQEIEQERRAAAARACAPDGMVFIGRQARRIKLRVTVNAVTDAGVPHSDVSEEILAITDKTAKVARKR
ncbi:hypothetical protein [Actinomyces qiguomingii]|uniref:hypothetical protein n=1 Tax=Actinomyces qiguomingii TaxID=2057800 RepID=UPI000CA07D81|nr:hypothetical protein [Actinomyces qiguomingii]